MTARQDEHKPAGRKSPSRRAVLVALGALPVLSVATPRASAAAAVAVDPAARRQTIRGFGGMNHPEWAGDLTAAQRDTAFGSGTGQLGFSILRIHVDEDKANWSKEVATAQAAVAHGALVFASPWNPPASMTETFTRGSQTDAKRLRYDMYGAYAQHLNDFCTFMKSNGVDLYAISVQNEPDYASTWTWWTASEIVTFLRNNAGSIGTKVIAPESFQYVKSMSDPILNDATALANLDILGAHLYGTAYSNFPYPLFQQKGQGKELWMTEVYYPNSTDSADLWPAALGVGEHMHHAMVDAEFQAYVWWYIRRSYGPLREDGQISKRGAVMAQFARFVRPGCVRLTITANPQTNVYTSAYAYADGSKVVIVAVNTATSTVSQQFTVSGATSGSVSAYVTDGSRNVAATTGPGMSGGTFTASLPAQSITTYVVPVGGSSGGDTQAPTAPGAPTASAVTSGSVTLSWTAATDNVGVTGYDVVRVSGSTETAAASSTTNQAVVTGLTAGTAYTFAVYARDAAGNRSSRSTTTTVTTTTGTPTGTCGIGYQVTNSWSGGFQGEIVISNTSSTPLDGWTLAFSFTAGQTITQMWGGTPAQNGSAVTVTPADYTRAIPAGGSVTIGFLANQGGTNPAPTAFVLNGGTCTTAG
ncbi:cellulose binding domain-containing protein [Streptomyces sp. NPDC021224]|uniref:cellulose binding domain-containing protein n=1 Tax=unclassified Streptomyces TaxID=2593676 RepID=UPI0037AE117C